MAIFGNTMYLWGGEGEGRERREEEGGRRGEERERERREEERGRRGGKESGGEGKGEVLNNEAIHVCG